MEANTQKINIPVYKTGYWTDEVVYLICSTKIKELTIPATAKVGFDSIEIVIEECFSINLN